MKKLLFVAIGISSVFILAYSIIWFYLITSLSNTLNHNYANRIINAGTMGGNQEYSITFRKITHYGFPFKLGIQLLGWQEESKNTLIEFLSPIRVGYDLLKQSLFISYSGEAIGHYKPIKLKFGAAFRNPYTIFTIHIPLSINLLKILVQERDLFQIVNFIQKIEFKSEGTEILDLYDNKILYQEASSVVGLTFEKKKYYTDIEDFKNNVPQRLDITYAAKILASDMYNRKLPAGILLYRFVWPTSVDFEAKLYVKTTGTHINEFVKNVEIEIVSPKFSTNIFNAVTSLLYRNKMEQEKINSYIKASSTIHLKPGFSNALLDGIPFVLKNSAIAALKLNPFISELKYINDNKEKFSLVALENRPYILDLDINFTNVANKQLAAQINNLSLFSNETGLRLTSECKFNDIFKDFDIKGLIVFNNYAKIIDFVTNYIFKLERFKTFSEDSIYVYNEGIKDFLRTISDHPGSKSNNISFEYQLNSSNIKNGKIGTVESEKILPLYYLSLYSKAATKIRPGDNVLKRMHELVPGFNEHQKLLQHLLIQPFKEVDAEIWKNIIK